MRPDWTEFYVAMADRLGSYAPAQLYELIKGIAAKEDFLGYMHFDDAELWRGRGHNLDPFSVMAIFNRGQTDARRARIAAILAKALQVDLAPPQCFHGIPFMHPRHSIFDGDSQMWALYKSCLDGPDGADFAAAYDGAKDIKGNALGDLSIGLFWMRPDAFMAVDRISSPYLYDMCQMRAPKDKCSGAEYAEFLRTLRACLDRKGLSYPEVAYAAWQAAHVGEACGEGD